MLTIENHKSNALYSAILALGLLLQPGPAAASIEADRSSAVIFAYQRIGEDAQPRSSLSLDQFRAHIRQLKTGGYTVLPLTQIVEALREGHPLPQRCVALTFDGAWLSTLNNAVPLLVEAGFPFTVFFASEMADSGAPNHASWRDLKALKRNKRVSFGIFPSSYDQMTGHDETQVSALINRAIGRYTEELRETPRFFAYPYGEYSAGLRKQVSGYAFQAAFGQQSGVAHGKSDFMALPRFTMTDSYGDLDRFMLTANALPLPVSDVIPDDMLLTENPPAALGFSVTPELSDLSRLSCFASGLGKLETSKIGNRIEIRLDQPFPDRRNRINCTMPDATVIPGELQNWRWFGLLMVVDELQEEPLAEGEEEIAAE